MESGTHFAFMQSSIVFAGLPIAIGSLPRAYRNGAKIDPAPGKRPVYKVILLNTLSIGGSILLTAASRIGAIFISGYELTTFIPSKVLKCLY
jgi:hypothetical protein